MNTYKKHRNHISLLMYYRGVRTAKVYGVCLLILLVLPMLSIGMKEYDYFLSGYYNEFILQPLCFFTYPVIFLSWFLYTIYDLRKQHGKYNVHDREWILPCSHWDVIISNILFTMATLLGIMILQTMVYYLGNQLYNWKVGGEILHNGFFLSVTRSFYTSFFIALSPKAFLVMLLHVATLSVLSTFFGKWQIRKHKLLTTLIILFCLQFVVYIGLVGITLFSPMDYRIPMSEPVMNHLNGFAFYIITEKYIVFEIILLILIAICMRKSMRKNTW